MPNSAIPATVVAFSSAVCSLGDQLAARLAERIIFGEIPPEQRITEDSIEQWAGVSRSPIREAFRLLERDGLVRRETNRGVTVTSLDAGQLDDLYRMRVVLEAQAAELAAQRATAADIAALQTRYDALQAALASRDPRQYFRANIEFSEAVHAAAHSDKLREILRIIGGQAMRFRFLAYQRSERFPAESFAGAGRVLDAIRRHDADAAASITAALLTTSWTEIRNLLAAVPL